MPNKDSQVTEKDFIAPEGKFRIIRKSMDDGQLNIVADFHDKPLAGEVLLYLIINKEDVFTLWDDRGKELLKDTRDKK